MSVIKAIYNAPVDIQTYNVHQYSHNIEPCDTTNTVAYIEYDGELFIGFAALHLDDIDFYSPKVGKTIATSRARIHALKYARDKAIDTYNIKRQFYNEVVLGQDYDWIWDEGLATADLIMLKNIEKAKQNIDRLTKAIKAEKKGLHLYLKDLDKVVESVKRQRANAAADNKANED